MKLIVNARISFRAPIVCSMKLLLHTVNAGVKVGWQFLKADAGTGEYSSIIRFVRCKSASTCIHEVAKELPASGDLKEGEALLLSHSVQSCTGGHAASHTLHTISITLLS